MNDKEKILKYIKDLNIKFVDIAKIAGYKRQSIHWALKKQENKLSDKQLFNFYTAIEKVINEKIKEIQEEKRKIDNKLDMIINKKIEIMNELNKNQQK